MIKPLKYPLDFDNKGIAKLSLPQDSEILSVQLVRGRIVLYTLSDLTRPTTQVETFKLAVTGEELDDSYLADWEYMATIQLSEGHFISHVFREVY